MLGEQSMGSSKNYNKRFFLKGETYTQGLDRIENLNDGTGNVHDKWKEQIISDIIILAIFIGLVIFIVTR